MKKKHSPLVSVIINCHNGEKYLSDCINSVIDQTYKNWEIIFWDNCSTDNSFNVINTFSDKRIKKYRSKSFTKLYKARNLALKKSKGKFITFLDVDDIWLKNKLFDQIEKIKKDNTIKIIYTNYFIYFSNKKKKYQKFKKKLPSGFITQKLLDNYVIGILTILISRDIFKKKLFDSSYNIIGDFDFFINLSLNYKFTAIQKPLAILRLHNYNLSNRRIDLYLLEMKAWLKNNIKKFRFMGYSFGYLKLLVFKLQIKIFLKKFLNLKMGV